MLLWWFADEDALITLWPLSTTGRRQFNFKLNGQTLSLTSLLSNECFLSVNLKMFQSKEVVEGLQGTVGGGALRQLMNWQIK